MGLAAQFPYKRPKTAKKQKRPKTVDIFNSRKKDNHTDMLNENINIFNIYHNDIILLKLFQKKFNVYKKFNGKCPIT